MPVPYKFEVSALANRVDESMKLNTNAFFFTSPHNSGNPATNLDTQQVSRALISEGCRHAMTESAWPSTADFFRLTAGVHRQH